MRDRAAQKGSWLLFGISSAMAMPWPILAPSLESVLHHGERRGAIALAVCLAIEALAFVAGARAGARLIRRHGWRVPAMLGFCAGLVGLVGAALTATVTGFVAFWAVVGLSDGLSRPALRTTTPAGPQTWQPQLAGHLFGAAVGGAVATSWGRQAALIGAGLCLATTFAYAFRVESNARAALRALVVRSKPADPTFSLRWMIFFIATALIGMLALRYTLPLAFNSADLPMLAVAQALVLSDLAILWFGSRWDAAIMITPTFGKIAQAVAMAAVATTSLVFGAVDPSLVAGVILSAALLAASPILAWPRASRHSLA
jgi:hypothetical protein